MDLNSFIKNREFKSPDLSQGDSLGGSGSLGSFLQSRGIERPQGLQEPSTGGGSLMSFMERRGIKKPSALADFGGISTERVSRGLGEAKEKGVSTLKDTFRWLGKQLYKGTGISAKVHRGSGEIIGNLMALASGRIDVNEAAKRNARDFLKATKGSWNVLTGKEETDFAKEFEDAGIEVNNIISLGADIVLDPLAILKPVKLVKEAGKITKLDKPTKFLGEVIKEMPVYKRARGLVSNTTGNKEFDEIVGKFRSLKDYREGRLIDDAIKLQKDLKKISKVDKTIETTIVNALENPQFLKTITDKKTLEIINGLQKTYKNFFNEVKKVGLTMGEIKDYAPHIVTKEAFANKLKTQFGLGAKEFSIPTGIKKGRTMLKYVADDGEELYGIAKKVGLTPVEYRNNAGKITKDWSVGATPISFKNKAGKIFKAEKKTPTIDELVQKGVDIFEKNPAVQLAVKGQQYAKAITSKQFTNAVKKFAIKDGVDVTNPMLKGFKFAKDQARVIDNYYQGIKPEEFKILAKSFDTVQNIWKAQALVSPSYHLRNFAGNIWNNFIAGVNPFYYGKALAIQMGNLKDPATLKLIDEAKKLGVLNEGWYAKDIAEEVIQRVDSVGKWRKTLNPLSMQNAVFKLNRKVGTGVENNARLSHYLSKLDGGMSPEQAAQSVKKYLFDYGDLTKFEQSTLKRAAPFYTWTRKNIPIQLEGILTQPAKYALPHKIINRIEAGVEVPDERYMGPYIKENIPVRSRTNKEGATEYFLLGNWLPYAAAIDVLSNPIDTLLNMTTPVVKAPYEYWSEKSTFFQDTLGKRQEMEGTGEFLGGLMKKKNIQLLRNIRVLNDVNKLIDKKSPYATKSDPMAKLFSILFGKVATYDVKKSKYFYDKDTDEEISRLKAEIKKAKRQNRTEAYNKLSKELLEFKEERRGY